jgi:hypothetical protein
MNVVTSLLGLVIVSHLSPKGSGRFNSVPNDVAMVYIYMPVRCNLVGPVGHWLLLF